uniref:Uncharacterized protein n=1 Tax=Parascaris equorum TaxID=6256 RepID=A0A914S743_PAREQ
MALNKWKLDSTSGGSRIVSRVVDACFNPPGFSQSVSVVQQVGIFFSAETLKLERIY